MLKCDHRAASARGYTAQSEGSMDSGLSFVTLLTEVLMR
jgi:hypothetical protein